MDNRLPIQLNQDLLLQATSELAARDEHLAGVVARYGPPPMWNRPHGFSTLLYIILEQQVSLASARAAYDRLLAAANPLTPARLLEFNDEELKTIGFSRQKAGYARHISRLILERRLDLDAVASLEDDLARAALLAVKGVGPWTADIYLLMVLLRPDVWPHGDRALALSVQRVMGLPETPAYEDLGRMALSWRPWRAVAARLFWHDYLSRKVKP